VKKAKSRTDILIVEDSPTQTLQLQSFLKQKGFVVSAVRDGDEALRFLARKKPRLVVSDIVLKDMDGFELCRRIRADAALRNVGVVLWTHMAAPENLAKGREAGALAVVRKSLGNEAIHEVLQRLFSGAAAPAGAADPAGAAAPGAPAVVKRVLIVEDSQTQAALLHEELRVRGYETQTAANGSLALEAARRHPPDLIISDIRMPVMDGIQLCREIKQDPDLRGIPVILLTSLSRPADVLAALEAGADFHIPKPYQSDYLAAKMVEVFSRRGDGGRAQPGTPETLTFDGKAYQISATREHVLRMLLSTYEVALQQNQELLQAEAELTQVNATLEERVRDRTSNLVAEIAYRQVVEEREMLAREVLDILNRPEKAQGTIRDILLLVMKRTGIQAAGIRLREDEDYPYFESRGFPDDFLKMENSLLARDAAGRIVRNAKGVLECMCGNIITGRTDPTLPFFTENGSFWTNSTTDLLATTTEKDRQTHTRNTCNSAGYESVALVPLRSGGEVIGLLQLNDKRRDRFTLEMIKFFEGLGASIGIAIQRRRALARIEELARFPTENPNPVMRVTNSGALLYANPASQRLLQEWAIGVGSPIPKDWLQLLEKAMAEGVAAKADLRCADGTFAVTVAPVSDGGYANLYAEDVTERLLLESKLLQSQKLEAIGTLAGGVAHDFNNMLAVIQGYTDQAMKKLANEDPGRQCLEKVKSATQRSIELVRQLLTFARKEIIEPKVVDLNDTLAEMLKMLERLIREDIELRWVPGKDLSPIRIDLTQLNQVLITLLVNGRDAISGGGKLVIETGHAEFDEKYCALHTGFTPGQFVMLAVSDNGCGMSKEIMGRIFEPFFTTKPHGQGTGLGLATVYGIVKQNDGFINVYSEPGSGTTFRIYLPRQQAGETTAVQPREHVEALTGTETVLLVEDEEALLELGKILLDELGYTVLAADTPSEAIKLAGEHAGQIHLLLTDVILPEMSGRELQQRLNLLRPGMKCLFMSGYTANIIVQRGVLEEGIHFLPKPFSGEMLAAKLREVLSG